MRRLDLGNELVGVAGASNGMPLIERTLRFDSLEHCPLPREVLCTRQAENPFESPPAVGTTIGIEDLEHK